ncbi:Toll-interacting protein [Amphibalanus amphitrite]|uniref:Toll-interacting protein n=1 Tax=Amphibalanus amphitrite TaxID=1232801 RepID=A0A6A4VM17_AMPAM|nr:Toll-interacting protein [Amphibalanus amphitrite]
MSILTGVRLGAAIRLPAAGRRVRPHSGAGSTQEELDRQAALALARHYNSRRQMPATQTAAGRLNLTIAQAKLTKNYGLTRMDPYVRLRLGHCVYETQTCYNGATNPRWNKSVMCYVPHGVTSMHLEIYDECSFTDDQLVAQATIQIPDCVITGGETSDDWHPLSGKQGDGKEGMINLIMNYTPMSGDMSVPAMPGQMPVMVAPQPYIGLMPTIGVPVYSAPAVPTPQAQPPARPPPVTPEDVAQLKEMFPAMDDEIIRSVLEQRGGDKGAATTSLLELTET